MERAVQNMHSPLVLQNTDITTTYKYVVFLEHFYLDELWIDVLLCDQSSLILLQITIIINVIINQSTVPRGGTL